MYTRSRSSSGGPGFGNGRGQMNPGNGNSFQGAHSYNHQGGNYQQSNYKPGIIQPSAPFKPSGPPTPVQQQGMKPRQGNQQHPNQQHQGQQHQNQPNQSSPVQKLKPILKQSNLNLSSGPAQPSAAPSPVPPPSANNPSAPATPANSTPTTPAATPSPANVTAAAAVPPTTPTTPTVPSAAAAIAAAKSAMVNAPAKGELTPTKIVGAADKTADATVNKPADTTGKTGDATGNKTTDASGNKKADPTGNEKDDPTGEKKGDSAANQSEEPMEGDDSRRWVEDDDQGRWMETDDPAGQWLDVEDGQATPKVRREEWRRIKKLTTKKPNKVLKRLRMNRRLRKTLMPKNALMVLNEMKAGVNFTFPETQAIMPNSLFLVHAELEGKVYVGQGLSKPLARQNAAENALKCLLLEKMTAAAMKERVETEGESTMEVGENPSITEASNEENGEEAVEENDDIPWSSLASFALYKLFLEWQNQGTVVPIPRPGGPPLPKNRAEPKTLTDKVLPTNALDIHPVMLLNQMRPGTTYNEVGRVGNPPNIQFTLGVEINGKPYTGTVTVKRKVSSEADLTPASAKNKKDAKKIAAKEALKDLYNLEYPDEPKPEIADPVPQC